MSNSDSPVVDEWRSLAVSVVQGEGFRRATFAGAQRGPSRREWMRVVVRPVELRGETWRQFSYFDAKKDITKNALGTDAATRLEELLDVGFAGIHLETETEQIDIRLTKKGKATIGRRASIASDTSTAHNRVKEVPLPEGRADRVLEVMGILTSGGRVRPTMRAKFTQINEFLKHLHHTLDEANLRSLGRDVEILDCGCGSSYLTIAVHHYLRDVLGIPAKVLGVDVNDEVIRKSIARSEQLGPARPSFECGPIGEIGTKADIVLALHACDTATDDALAQAIRGEAKVILSVPCCHHFLNDHLRAEALRPLLRHGILKQRTADLVTDAFRALILRMMGYKTDVVEFVGTEHTPRNLMIRAVRGAPVGERAFVDEYRQMRDFWGVTPYLETKLGPAFGRLIVTNDDRREHQQ